MNQQETTYSSVLVIVCKTGNLAETNFTKRTGKGSVMNWMSAYIQAVATLSSRYAIFSNSTEGTTTWNTISGMTRTLRDHWSFSIPIFDEVEGLLDQHENRTAHWEAYQTACNCVYTTGRHY